jgi:hypothetical protein
MAYWLPNSRAKFQKTPFAIRFLALMPYEPLPGLKHQRRAFQSDSEISASLVAFENSSLDSKLIERYQRTETGTIGHRLPIRTNELLNATFVN